MPAEIPYETRRRMVRLRALDYTKQEIAEELDVSRNTVSRHLEQVREEVESSDQPEMVLAELLFDPDDLLPFLLEQSPSSLSDVNVDLKDLLTQSLLNRDSESSN